MGYRRADYGQLFHVGTREMWALYVFTRAWVYLSVHRSERGRWKTVMYVRDHISFLADTFDLEHVY